MKTKMNIEILAPLIANAMNGTLDQKDKEDLDSWLAESEENIKLYMKITDKQNLKQRNEVLKDFNISGAWNNVEKEIKTYRKRKLHKQIFRYAAAIVIPITIMVSVYFYMSNVVNDQIQPQASIEKGTSEAILILANGKNLELGGDSAKQIIEDDGTIIQFADANINYSENTEKRKAKEIMNKLVVPKGGEYNLILSDGSKVFVNSMSTLEFPVQFIGNTRTVKLEGEAYFEVAHNKTKPFFVEINGISVEVLGTSFNVKAYPDEILSYTTLIEGKVKLNTLSSGKGGIYLKPNQQAVYSPSSSNIIIQNVDANKFVQWIHGRYVFENESLGEIMKTLSRWYDFEYSFENKELEAIRFEGGLNKYESIYPILDIMNKTNKINVNIEGKEIYFTAL